ncbi:MAG: DUF1697 domain-containing protein [Acidimicrobiia bacterium]|nr:DUF1697 domain-containing protein [Acidimicrobiia bacterium]
MADGDDLINRYVVLLRGINVGGHNKVPMAALREKLSDRGFDDVTTYIASGNVLLDAGDRRESEVVDDVADAVAERFGFSIPVVARPVADWPGILAANPFPDAEAEPKLLHISLCDRPPEPDTIAAFDVEAYLPDRLEIIGRELYLWYPNGSGRSKLTGAVLERALGVTTTARNWSTMLKLAELAQRPAT